MNLVCEPLLNGIMAYWDRIEDAAVYNVHLYIGKDDYVKRKYQEIAIVEVERNLTYYSFTNLAKIDLERCTGKSTGKDYYICVEAENRNGQIIDKTDKVLGKVYIMFNGYFSLSN